MLRITTVITGYAGSPYYNNLYFEENDNQQDAMNRVVALWTQLGTQMHEDAEINIDPTVAVLNPASGQIIGTQTANPGDPFNGSLSDEPLPIATQILGRISTGSYTGGREIRGRLYVPCLTQIGNENGRPSAGQRSVVLEAMENLLNDPGDVQHAGVWSRKNGVFRESSAVSVWNEYAVLRSRRD